MNRREAIFKVAGLMGASFSAPLLMGLSNYEKRQANENLIEEYAISENFRKMIEEIAELILPETSTPGAKAAGVPQFIEMMIEECYVPKDKDYFYAGLDDLDKLSISRHKQPFLNSLPEERTKLLLDIEKEIRGSENHKSDGTPFFIMFKELTLLGYFTSEIGCTQALAYIEVPGAYKSCITLEPNQKTWAL